MIQENEILALALGLGVLLFFVVNRNHLKRGPSVGLLVTGLCMLLLAFVFSILEGFFWGTFFNLAEHGCYLLSAVCLTVWVSHLPLGPKGMDA